MPKKSAAPLATISPETLDKHPLMLTRALDESAAPIVAGEYTLETLRSTFNVEGDKDTVLLELSARGCAFFVQGDTYYAFTPKQGDLNLPIETEEMGADEPAIVIIDPDELAEGGEGEPDSAPLVEEEREELEAAPQPAPAVQPVPAIDPAIAPTDDAPAVEETPAAEDLADDDSLTDEESGLDF